MKKIILIIGLCLLSTTAWAQQKPLSSFFNKYKSDSSFTVINISPQMFSMFAQMHSDSANNHSKQVKNIAEDLTGLRIITSEHAVNSEKLFNEAYSLLSGKNYATLMTVKSDGNHIKFLIKKGADGMVHNLIMLIGGDGEFFAMSLTGDISLSELSKIAGGMNIQGFNMLKNLKNKDNQ